MDTSFPKSATHVMLDGKGSDGTPFLGVRVWGV